ncbi:MAG: YraN family protein [Polyangiaceae bacterium]|nr:YraN family protein [Polyangiaceae bacterium]
MARGAPAGPDDPRRAAERARNRARAERGRRAEDLAVRHLEGAGLEILGRNVRVGSVEVDVVAREGAVVAVIEVRTRGVASWQGALASVDGRKRARLERAATQLWARTYARLTGVERMRFDVVCVDLAGEEPSVEHLRAAF